MKALTAEQIQELARAVQQLDSEPDRPRAAGAYWAEIGRRLGLTQQVAFDRGRICGIRPRGLVRKPGKGEPCVFSEKFKR